jgi:hypothetical protein
MKILKSIVCFFIGHKWTCNAEKGILATPEQLRSVEGFAEYSAMYCDRCKKKSALNKRLNFDPKN